MPKSNQVKGGVTAATALASHSYCASQGGDASGDGMETLSSKWTDKIDSIVDSVHRLGKKENGRHRHIVIHFTMRHFRDELWRLTKGSAVCKELNVSFAEHVLPADREARVAVWPQIKQAREAAELSSDECKKLFYLCGNLDTDRCVEDVSGMLKSVMNSREVDRRFLLELMFRIRRYDILSRVLRTNKCEVEGILGNGGHLSEYRVLMVDVGESLGADDMHSLMFLLTETLPTGRMGKATSFLDVVVELEKLDKVSCGDVELIEQCLHRIRRVDLAKRVQQYRAGGEGSSGQESRGALFTPPVHHSMCHRTPTPLAPENIKMAVPETGWQYGQSPVEVYRMRGVPRGVCVIFDCVGSDGDMLEQTFSRLHFRVILCKWPSVEEVRCTLLEESQRSGLQGEDAFVCCLLSRATSTHLLATEPQGPGLRLEAVRHLFTTEACPGLVGKPKLFFIQSYCVPEPQACCRHRDEDLVTDGPASPCTTETIPTGADVFWSQCRTDEQQLQFTSHHSVYLQSLSAVLLDGQRRKLHLVDVHTEVNAVVYEHNQRNPAERYSVSLRHTLRKNLFLC
ncbi:hypothetical protein AAFF_G00367750 [Aldrovandia affinis]|uniref:CASP8 and FADD-like apoptosis regulator n=1 Tax=Aldrovandia affinis TaxID=143900 RepID=A0AAD7R4P3_9TELE|nr:hypothetical protein AAFF_G00367750 [Aldrovandia affinis]